MINQYFVFSLWRVLVDDVEILITLLHPCRYAARNGPSYTPAAAQWPHNAPDCCSESTSSTGYFKLSLSFFLFCSSKGKEINQYLWSNTSFKEIWRVYKLPILQYAFIILRGPFWGPMTKFWWTSRKYTKNLQSISTQHRTNLLLAISDMDAVITVLR